MQYENEIDAMSMDEYVEAPLTPGAVIIEIATGKITYGAPGTSAERLAAAVGLGAGEWQEHVVEAVELPLEEAMVAANTVKYAEILAGANAMDTAIKARYSTPEIASFEQQRQGAETIIANPDVTGTPGSPVALVRGLAAAEGVSAASFAERILFNVAQASAAMEAILLQQRAYEAALKRAATVEEIEAITVKYTLG